MSPLSELDAFSLEHRHCIDLDGGVDGDVVCLVHVHLRRQHRQARGR